MERTIMIEELINSRMERLDNWKVSNPFPNDVDVDTLNQWQVNYQSNLEDYKRLSTMLNKIEEWKKEWI